MRFDRKKFFDGYRQELAGVASLTQARVDALSSLLDFIEADQFLTRIEWPAYMLGTVMIETAYTFKPIHEYGGHDYFVRRYGSQTKKGRELGNDTPEEGADYSGQGDVQLTGESNYEKAEAALRKYYPEVVAEFERRTGRTFDLTVGDQPGDKDDPKNASDPVIAYFIMSFGMRTGMFTGKKLPTTGNIAANWRAIINGTDRNVEIAGLARKFLKILNDALVSNEVNPASSLFTSATASPVSDSADTTRNQGADPGSPTGGSDNSDGTGSSPLNSPVVAPPAPDAVSVPPVATAQQEGIVSKVKGWYAALPATLLTAAGGVWSWLQGAATEIIITFFVSSAAIAITYIAATMWLKNKREARLDAANEAQKQRDFELTKLQLQSAMDPSKQTVLLAPPPTEIPNSESAAPSH